MEQNETLTVEWEQARQLPTRAELSRPQNIFAGGSTLEKTKLDGVEVLRLTAWPEGQTAAPYSFAVSLLQNSPTDEDGEFAQEKWPDDWEEDPNERRLDNNESFAEEFNVVSQDGRWTPSDATLPLNLQWQQSSSSRWQFFFDLAPGARCLGLGERLSGLNLRSRVHTLFNTDNDKHVESMDSMYKSIPFLIVQDGDQCYGLFLDSPARQKWSLDVNLDNVAAIELLSKRGWQLYCIGPTSLPNLVKAFTVLTGRSKLPPMWSLGHQQCRWSYPDQETVIRIAQEFRSRQIPCDGIVLDIDYMDNYKVFTYSQERFPEFKQMISDLDTNNFKVTAIVDPGVKKVDANSKKDGKYFVYADGKKHDFFCKKSDGKTFHGEVWPGQSAFPDFARQDVRLWWAAHHGFHTELGIAGIWNDMNEPAIFHHQTPLDMLAEELPADKDQIFMQQSPEGEVGHYELRNIYGSMMSKATHEGLLALRPNTRPFVLTRSGYAGVQKYAAVWLGDNMSWWHHLARSIPMLINMGLSGVAFAGVDIGGFGFDCTGELLSRWYSVGIFYPYFRNHCWMKGSAQEPWAFGPQVEAICKKFIETRYQLLPYIYSLFWEYQRTGAPLLRPLSWLFPDDQFAAEVDDQFLFGDKILVAPILERARKTRSVYLPAGKWYPFEGGEPLMGGQLHQVSFELDQIPAFVAEGSIIPMADVMQSTAEYSNVAITFACYGESAKGSYFEDDGQTFEYENGSFNEWRLKWDGGQFAAQPVALGFELGQRQYKMKQGDKIEPVELLIN